MQSFGGEVSRPVFLFIRGTVRGFYDVVIFRQKILEDLSREGVECGGGGVGAVVAELNLGVRRNLARGWSEEGSVTL